MNSERRKRLSMVEGLLAAAQAYLEEVRDEEQEYYDRMPEGIQMGQRGEKTSDVISAMEDALTSIEEATEYLDSAAE